MSVRLSHPSMTATGRPVRFWYDGQPREGLEGETLAAALAASGIRELRHTRGGDRRGLYCGMGACFDCLVTVDGRASQRACLTKVAEGQQVRSAMPAGMVDDPLRPLAPEAGSGPARREVNLLVIGAGPAGLSAALAARRAGAGVLVLDERLQTGVSSTSRWRPRTTPPRPPIASLRTASRSSARRWQPASLSSRTPRSGPPSRRTRSAHSSAGRRMSSPAGSS